MTPSHRAAVHGGRHVDEAPEQVALEQLFVDPLAQPDSLFQQCEELQRLFDPLPEVTLWVIMLLKLEG